MRQQGYAQASRYSVGTLNRYEKANNDTRRHVEPHSRKRWTGSLQLPSSLRTVLQNPSRRSREVEHGPGTFDKANIDAKLVVGISIGKLLEIRASTLHGNGIKGTIYFQGDLAQGAVGSFKKPTPFDNKFTVYPAETYFEAVYAIVSTEKPV